MPKVQYGDQVPGQGTAKYLTQVEIEVGFFLILNPMTGSAEDQEVFGPWPDKQTLRDWYESQKHPGGVYYEEGHNFFRMVPDQATKRYRKTFKPDSQLAWFNPFEEGFEQLEVLKPLEQWGQPKTFGHGVYEQVVGWRELSPTNRSRVF